MNDLRQSFDALVPPKQAAPPPRPAGGPPARSVVDAFLVITGNLQSERDVQVDGQIHGDICCSQLTISKDATINGNVTAEQVVIRGKVKGVIRADQVVLQDTAHVEGDIFHKSLIVEQGASFDGQSHCLDQTRSKPQVTKAPGERERAAQPLQSSLP